MSCNTCQTKFSFFTKEHACPNCGFSYCSKCLKYKRDVPDKGTMKVCGSCNNKLATAQKDNTFDHKPDLFSELESAHDLQAPIDITRRLESLGNPAKPPITMYQQSSHWDKFKEGLAAEDQEIVDRLQKLKDEDKTVSPPSVEEIKERLAILKDQDPGLNVVDINHIDRRSDQQKTDDLIQEYLSRLELSSSTDTDKGIQDRLNALKGTDAQPPSSDWKTGTHHTDVDDDEVSHNLIRVAVATGQLEARTTRSNVADSDVDDVLEVGCMVCEAVQSSSDEDEKLSCVMCERTVDLIRCLGCNGDLYCAICFEDNHDDFELGRHKRVPFDPTRKN